MSLLVLETTHKNLDAALDQIISGFSLVINQLDEKPKAISMAFPGPADYKRGIIGDLPNLPVYRGGVALGPILENHFKIPTFINNDGDLFALGEAHYGALVKVNDKLREQGKLKQYHNLLAVTLGTGFGAGIVNDGKLLLGDNSVGAEIWLTRNFYTENSNSEEHVGSIAIQGLFKKHADYHEKITPLEIYQIAKGQREGNREAAIKCFEIMGRTLGEALSNAVTLLDSPIVIGGGLSNAIDLFGPAMMEVMRSKFSQENSSKFSRLCVTPYLMTEDVDRESFYKQEEKMVEVPTTGELIRYNEKNRFRLCFQTLALTQL